jgi:hypothetical protein
MVTHGTLLAAAHAQPLPAVTATLPVPPPTATSEADGLIENEQAPPWFTVNV